MDLGEDFMVICKGVCDKLGLQIYLRCVIGEKEVSFW